MGILKNPRAYFDGPAAVGILFLRIFVGFAMASHGQGKIANPFGWMDAFAPGVPGILQALAALAEFGGGLALMFGLFTPLACLGIMSTMAVATLMHLTNDATPTYFVKPQNAPQGADSYESALLYFVPALTILLTGPGILSADAAIFGRKAKPAEPTPAAPTPAKT